MPYLVLFIVALILLFWGNLIKRRKQAGIQGWIKDQDLDGRGRRLYKDQRTGVVCKPDVVERHRVIEYKSAIVDKKPRWVDMLQLALQIKSTGSESGELRYGQNKSFSFKRNSKEIRSAMNKAVGIVKRMRWHLMIGVAPKGTPTRKRCAVCVFSRECLEAAK